MESMHSIDVAEEAPLTMNPVTNLRHYQISSKESQLLALRRELFKSLVQESLIKAPNASGGGEADDTYSLIDTKILEVSSTKDVRFLHHVLDFCNTNSKDSEDGARLWQQLRSVKGKDGYSALHRAVIVGFRPAVELLMTGFGKWPENHSLEFSDFDVLHDRTPQGWTPLHFAAVTEGFSEPVVVGSFSQPIGAQESELAGGANEAVGTEGVNEDMLSSLMILYDKVRKPDDNLWDFGDNFWMTPLHYAVLANRQAHVEQLLAWKAYDRHVNAGDYHRKTPFHMAVCHPKAPPLQPCNFLQTPEPPTQNLSIKLIRTLAECPKVNIHAVDCCLYTPLHWAVHLGNTDTVRCLISPGSGKQIRATLKDIEGRPVMQLAMEKTAVDKSGEGSDQQNSEYSNGGGGTQTDKPVIDREAFEDIQRILLNCDDVKDEIEGLSRDRQIYLNATNAVLVAAALVAGVTFQGCLQPPTGNTPSEHHVAKTFNVFNTFSFFSSIAALMVGVAAVLPTESNIYVGYSVRCIRRRLYISSVLLFNSLAFAIFAFSMAATIPQTKLMVIETLALTGVCTAIIFWVYDNLETSSPFPDSEKKRGSGTGDAQLAPDLLSAARHIEQHFQKTGRKHHQDSALKSIEKNLQNTWTRSWGSSDQLSPGTEDVEQIIRVLSTVFDVEHHGKQSVDNLDNKADKVDKVDRQLRALETVYERVRIEMCGRRSKRSLDNMRFLSGSGLMPREIHFWMKRCPGARCRAHSLEMDQKRLECIVDQFHREEVSQRVSSTV